MVGFLTKVIIIISHNGNPMDVHAGLDYPIISPAAHMVCAEGHPVKCETASRTMRTLPGRGRSFRETATERGKIGTVVVPVNSLQNTLW